MAVQPELSQNHCRMRRLASGEGEWSPHTHTVEAWSLTHGHSWGHTAEPLGLKQGAVGNRAWPAAVQNRTSFPEGLLSWTAPCFLCSAASAPFISLLCLFGHLLYPLCRSSASFSSGSRDKDVCPYYERSPLMFLLSLLSGPPLVCHLCSVYKPGLVFVHQPGNGVNLCAVGKCVD